MDSCAVMLGSKKGLESRIRKELATHLLDVDGDVRHHVHNASKRLCGLFEQWTEKLANDLHNDNKWSVDLHEWLADVCSVNAISATGGCLHMTSHSTYCDCGMATSCSTMGF